ncbi:MAG: DUF3429 family protein [Alphaproteobacteria bacterium]|nr:DUF3429 family protein [Alphaproteobacteria bacterium]
MPRRIPAIALQLGLLGLLPFFGAALMSLMEDDGLSRLGFTAFSIYAAAILSFLGGVRWGIEIMRAPQEPNSSRLVFSVLPAIAAWALALYALTGPHALGVSAAFAGLFALQYVWDLRAARDAAAPAWYPLLRQILTGGVMLACLVLPVADILHTSAS